MKADVRLSAPVFLEIRTEDPKTIFKERISTLRFSSEVVTYNPKAP